MLNFFSILLSLVVNLTWSLHQLDVSIAFRDSEFKEQVFMEQPPMYISQGELLTSGDREAVNFTRSRVKTNFKLTNLMKLT